ncbi:hypothetical protein PG991_012202 [Apiospora marii]|uniref:Uncharacterized protein n=1 Tax=Apiospora marii TaxID=335849 RepID=A0ABR1RA12_9PEZI
MLQRECPTPATSVPFSGVTNQIEGLDLFPDSALSSRSHRNTPQHEQEASQFMSCLDWLRLNATTSINWEGANDFTAGGMPLLPAAVNTGTQSHAQTSLGISQGDDSSSEGANIEFSVTCTRAKLEAMVCHAFEGAMLEASELPDESQLTVTLRLKR